MRNCKLYMLSKLHDLDFCHKVNLFKPYCWHTENRDMKLKTLLSNQTNYWKYMYIDTLGNHYRTHELYTSLMCILLKYPLTKTKEKYKTIMRNPWKYIDTLEKVDSINCIHDSCI